MGAQATPTENTLPLRRADFSTLADALDYAAQGQTGCNFYNGRGELYEVLPYSKLREQALELARRLAGLGLPRESRLALVAETTPDFLRFFFACQYAGLVPVPLPIPFSLGSHEAYVRQLRAMLQSCLPALAMAPVSFISFLTEAAAGLDLEFFGAPEDFYRLPYGNAEPKPLEPDELAYLQYTSGSTRFPRGVMIRQAAVMDNLAGIAQHGVDLRPGDRAVSWLPFYHDMGLVGLMLTPVASQVSVDYLGTREFAMRPRQWLALMSRNKATISFGPPFGYELCTRRLRPGEAAKFDLSAWRVAGVGAEMIRTETLNHFAEALAPAGFREEAFLPCYGMAECSLAVSFAPLAEGVKVDRVDGEVLALEGRAVPTGDAERVNEFVDCGVLLPSFEMRILDADGNEVGERRIGTIHLRGPSVMSGYFEDPETTEAVLSNDGWLNTGDLGYVADGRLYLTGRAKDLIIVNGRNIWPQDLEYLAHRQPEVRPGDALAFGVPDADGDRVILVVQCRETDEAKRADLVRRIRSQVQAEIGVDCTVELVPLHTLPRTSSGKLSRSKARENYITQHGLVQSKGQRAAAL
ncbi:fatty-acyl-CoA synthase [Methylomarinovum caldicuralii]|uniref:Fatty-acyl-CoA synthase n=1 Tax=Methylomarinovum caldicuralii TaxID=438856 RepID=A0AAU9CII9_9GAMM|nr:fatty acyl-AMP ligase [Methylomarinovum caldicuralii]BCX81421.1 fatty-acyl-CoA synthase [Methylomarinovum caldicuralii]